jgi:sensor c-di-GMP phosphodiesterase-like protein
MAPFNSVSAQYILENLDNALEQQHVKVYFQPVIRTVSRQMCSMEALARWEDRNTVCSPRRSSSLCWSSTD